MKKALIFIVVLIVVAAAGYYAYDKYLRADDPPLWDFIPENALLIYESNAVAEVWNNTKAKEVSSTFSQMEAYLSLDGDLKLLDSLSGKNGALGRLLSRQLLISVHSGSKTELGVVYYLKVDDPSASSTLGSLIDHFKKISGANFSSRKYLRSEINEIKFKTATFSYIIDRNTFVGSFTPFLIEDVLRLQREGGVGFEERFSNLQKLPKLSKDDGNLYVNAEDLNFLFNTFISSSVPRSNPIANLASSMFLDVTINENSLLLNGFTLADDDQFLSIFGRQEPETNNLKYYVPNITSHFVQYVFSDKEAWFEDVDTYWNSRQQDYKNLQTDMLKSLNITTGQLTSWIGNNIAIAHFPKRASSHVDYLAYLHTEDANEGLNEINELSERVALANGDSVYAESYSTYEIRQLEMKNFIHQALSPLLPKSEETYYILIDDYLIFSNTIQRLKSLVQDIESENTWGRSVNYNLFLQNTLEEANLTYIANIPLSWAGLTENLSAPWQAFVNNDGEVLKNFQMASVQFSKLDDNFYTSIAVSHQPKEVRKPTSNFRASSSRELGEKVISKPWIVKNHISNLFEVALQDSSYNFKLFGEDGDLKFKDSLAAPIVDEIDQIDYYKNGKLQYFFVTNDKFYIIDRLGNYVENFPIGLTAKNPVYSRVIDYDKTRRYRFLIADDRGNIYLYNKEGTTLEGWNPRALGGALANGPFHIRVRKKDCFVAILKNGQVAIMNRRGEFMPGFPIDLNARIESDVFVKMGSDLSKTTLVTVSRDGRLMEFNLTGEVIQTNQLYKPTKDSRFRLVPDALGKSYIIVRRDLNRVVIVDQNLNEILAKDYLSAEEMMVQYYDFNLENKLYAITDPVQGFTYLYNSAGELVNSQPIDSENEIGVLFSEADNLYKIYSTTGNSFKILQF